MQKLHLVWSTPSRHRILRYNLLAIAFVTATRNLTAYDFDGKTLNRVVLTFAIELGPSGYEEAKTKGLQLRQEIDVPQRTLTTT